MINVASIISLRTYFYNKEFLSQNISTPKDYVKLPLIRTKT